MKRKKHKSVFDFEEELSVRGGLRGRPPEVDSGVSHVRREPVAARYPVLATFEVRPELPSLRTAAAHDVLLRCFELGRERPGRLEGGVFRLVHYALAGTHTLNFVVEAKGRVSLSRGIQGLAIRVAKGLNRLWGRKGKVFADRYDDRLLRTSDEVEQVMRDVLGFGHARRNVYSSEPGGRREPPVSAARSKLLVDDDLAGSA